MQRRLPQSPPKFFTRLLNNQGMSLISGIMTLSIMSLVGLNVAKLSTAQTASAAFGASTEKARYISFAGIEQGLDRLYWGNDPTRPTMNLYQGELTVETDPVLREVVATGRYKDATVKQKIVTTFSADCFQIDFAGSSYFNNIGAAEWSRLENISVGKNCTELDRVKVLEMRVLFGAPDPFKLVKHIDINGSATIYHVPASGIPGYPASPQIGTPNGGAESKQIITPSGYVFHNNLDQNMEIWWSTSYYTPTTVQIEVTFRDYSVYTSPVHIIP